ncbi:MAG TPA: DUF1552 domain-containing protein [Planctomycetota bacterium]|nr:DUF1552 domain-containing protein [Planctomycetota bacterium]
MHFLNSRQLSRRHMLRAAGVALGLPLLDAMLPAGLQAGEKSEALMPRRMVLIGRPLGLHAPFLFPEKAGIDHEETRYTKVLQPIKGSYTVISGISHVGYPQGHFPEVALFTGVSPAGVRSERDIRNTVSVDYFVADRVGRETRVPSLVLGSSAMSWNYKGVANPALGSSSQVFKQLFVTGTPDEIAREVRRLDDGQSILDGVRDQMKSLSNKLSASDRDRIDLFASSIREAEQRLQQDQAWAQKPKPKVDYKVQNFEHAQMIERERQWYDLVRLALQTDSTRVVLLMHGEGNGAKIPGLNINHHDASHHGQDENKIEQLAIVEEAELKAFADFITDMKKTDENGKSLLDKSSIVLASNLGNASAHKTDNLPVILAGGGFKHQGHLAFDRKSNKQLSNLYLRMIHQMGIEAPSFGCSNGALSDLG